VSGHDFCRRGASGRYGTAKEAQTWYLSERVSFRNGTIRNLAGRFSPHLNQSLTYACVLVFRQFHPPDSFKATLTLNS
jgi:hypothetical protein